ncbi:aromatic ring-hydroxylating oxygenase subunit alpha [Acinetobacter guillouiae]|uniref:aromatic ring-hydroxylating oxygenase subunit alpha n=1 Tax=Acinetobacter guillouiae TaxID=106649 RepID=UPI00125FAF3A|nr:aromatic ring-hydroxylating dioxygenase subunit alpha [Acinetobacter guillouiae]
MKQFKESPIDIDTFDQSYFNQESDVVYALPPESFTSEAFFQFELNAVWKRDWICVGHVSTIENVGDFFTFEIGDESLFAIRTRDGSVNVLSNVCRHRNMLLLEKSGNTRRIRCPLHAWIYNMEGELVSAPGLTDAANEEFDPKKVCLPKLKSEIWEGFSLINFDENATQISNRLGKLAVKLKNYDMANLKSAEPLKLESFDWNWKIFNDECYHCSYLHASSWGSMYATRPELVDEDVEFNDLENGIVSYNLISEHIDAAPTHTGKILQPHIETLTEQERTQLTYVTIAPNLLLVAMPDKVKYFLWLSKSAGVSTYGVSWMYPKTTLALETFRENYDKEHDDLFPVMVEDLFAWKRSFMGMKSSTATRGRLTNNEKVIKRLQNWLIDKYRLEDRLAKNQSANFLEVVNS